jgi:hypothetical protein
VTPLLSTQQIIEVSYSENYTRISFLCYLKLRLANFAEPRYSIAEGMVIYGYGLSLFLVFFHFPTRACIPQARAQGLLHRRCHTQTGEQVMLGGEEVMTCASKLSDQNT